jgi:hypothetical protein
MYLYPPSLPSVLHAPYQVLNLQASNGPPRDLAPCVCHLPASVSCCSGDRCKISSAKACTKNTIYYMRAALPTFTPLELGRTPLFLSTFSSHCSKVSVSSTAVTMEKSQPREITQETEGSGVMTQKQQMTANVSSSSHGLDSYCYCRLIIPNS